jgi:predicted O-methyltransferase YrrM
MTALRNAIRPTADYEAAFALERGRAYPVMDELESQWGYALDRVRLESAARVLACPVKRNPPNWQHGRLIYALGRRYLADQNHAPQTWVDIGTAKGFSACAMSWALGDAGHFGDIWSFDVIPPGSRQSRNSVDDHKTVEEFVTPFRAPAVGVSFHLANDLLAWSPAARINFAFIDGGHSYQAVRQDIETVATRQRRGDVIVLDDLQLPSVAEAVRKPWVFDGGGLYEITEIALSPARRYAIAVRQ